MKDVLEFFSVDHALSLLLLIELLEFVGGRIGDSQSISWWARGFAAAGFLFYAAAGIENFAPRTPQEFLKIGVQALFAMGTSHGLALVTLPTVRFLYLHLLAMPLERSRAAVEQRARESEHEQQEREREERAQLERQQKTAEERRKQAELANRPPPLTREQRMASAQERYDATLALLASALLDETELRAAKERAKQQYLRDLDEAMNEAIQHSQSRSDATRQDASRGPQRSRDGG